MFVPLHNLYEFVHQTLENKFLIWYFWPPGEKDLTNLVYNIPNGDHTLDFTRMYENHPVIVRYLPQDVKHMMVRSWPLLLPAIIAHDQEPLNFELYEWQNLQSARERLIEFSGVDLEHYPTYQNLNLRTVLPWSGQKKWILLHSELNSNEVEKYENSREFVCAFMWSHAFIARDWYRFAKHDQNIKRDMPHDKTFLVYALDHTGTRTYRKKFLQQINNKDLYNDCQVGSFNNVEVTSNSSASYDWEDHRRTSISVVLETTFDQRIHLTEKTLRPIACKHPFIVANGPGTLKFLRSYGFKTFSPWIDESYDDIHDDDERLEAIVNAMREFEQLPHSIKELAIAEMKYICDHNFQVFFSDAFEEQLVEELIFNVGNAYRKIGNVVDWNRIAKSQEILQDNNLDWLDNPAIAKFAELANRYSS